jgi:hypothetical protein
MTIAIDNLTSNDFYKIMISLFSFIKQYKESEEHDEILFDLTQCKFSSPFLLTPICSLFRNLRQKTDKVLSISTNDDNNGFNHYLDLIKFPNGLDPLTLEHPDYQSCLDDYNGKTYIPIICLPNDYRQEVANVRNEFFSLIQNHLGKHLSLEGNIKSGIFYIISELVNNIVQHSGDEYGYIFSQFYPKLGYMDLCILDTGVSILGSYKKSNIEEHSDSDLKAIIAAHNGVSAKNLETGRGFGIRTSTKMLVNGMGGSYMMLSGTSAFLKTVYKDRIFDLKDLGVIWNGTLIALRIPILKNKDFNYIAYLE